MTLLAKLIAQEEGFFRSGTLPARNHNPGDLRHSPHSEHAADAPDAIGVIDTDADGWEDLERQLQLDAERTFTLGTAIYSWAPVKDGNQPWKYLADVIEGFAAAGHKVYSTDSLAEVLKIQA